MSIDFWILFFSVLGSMLIGRYTRRTEVAELKAKVLAAEKAKDEAQELWEAELAHSSHLKCDLRERDIEKKANERLIKDQQRENDGLREQLEQAKLDVARYKARWCDEVTKREMDMKVRGMNA